MTTKQPIHLMTQMCTGLSQNLTACGPSGTLIHPTFLGKSGCTDCVQYGSVPNITGSFEISMNLTNLAGAEAGTTYTSHLHRSGLGAVVGLPPMLLQFCQG